MIARGLSDFLIHGKTTPWDHSPIDLLCREAGGYAAMLDDEQSFQINLSAPFMAASTKSGWKNLQRAIWF